ncbi:unnamed protein product, partial [Gongylonema pulchrum]|uniref:C-type lectin domain-containing protein n=1 Tax=Gongylonema pulchrum TaxID=637853 RepID=A0A183D0C6_9BILA
DCPAGWFQIGVDEFQSCFLYVGGVTTFADAVKFCQFALLPVGGHVSEWYVQHIEDDHSDEFWRALCDDDRCQMKMNLGAFVPYLRVDDDRQKQLAKRLDDLMHMQSGESTERHKNFAANFDNFHKQDAYDKKIWVAGVSIPLTHCGWLSTRSGSVGIQNCNDLLPFLCEKGVMPYEEPALWRGGVVIAVIALCILFSFVLVLAMCWFRKSKKRKEEETNRKDFIRASVRLSKIDSARKNNLAAPSNDTNVRSLQNL